MSTPEYTTAEALRDLERIEKANLCCEPDHNNKTAHTRLVEFLTTQDATITALRERVETAEKERDEVAELAAEYADEHGDPCPPDEWTGEARRRIAVRKAAR